MIGGRKIITLRGSTRFRDDSERINKGLSLKGNVVLTVAFYGNLDQTPPTPREKQLLDEINLRKIDLADTIYVINKDGYIGEPTAREITYAKEIYHMNPKE